MSAGQLLFWLAFGLLGVLLSAMFSGLEIGMYRLNRVRLHLLAQQGKRSAKIMSGLLSNRSAVLATLLVANVLGNHITSSSTSIILESWKLSTWGTIAISSLVVTPILFVFAETLPKDAFAVHADRLVYPFARLLWLLRWFLTYIGVLPLILIISDLPMRFFGGKKHRVSLPPRHHMNMLVREGVGYGLLSDEQSAIVQRVLELATRTVAHEMVPWKQVIRLNISGGKEALWKLAQETSVSRFPVIDDTVKQPGGKPAGVKVLGVVSLYDALRFTQEECPPVQELLREAIFFERHTPARKALATLRQEHGSLGIVMDRGRPVGVVSIKDLVEPITGELASW
jgi:CBS domain containing-hemolysin-like protein